MVKSVGSGMNTMKFKIKEEPPDDELSAILDNGIQLSSVDKEAEGLITQQIEEILPNEEVDDEEEDEEEEGQKPKRRLPCRYCDFKAKTKKELSRHESRHAIKGWYHECGYCDYVTYIRQRLIEHESKHTNTKPFKCEKCEFRTRFKADLYKHRAKHSTVKKFSCPQCDFRTKWCRNIKHHMLKHTEVRPHSCDICGFKFKRIQDLKYHLYRHNDVKPIQCEVCDFRCKTNYELKCHSLKHSNVKNFPCTFPGCTQRTKTKSDLTKHMQTHNKHNSYLCSICGKGFNTLTSLNKHKDRHSNVRKFKCGLCEKWFKNKPSLRAHMKIHSGIKPFQCDVCFRCFLNKYNMHKHKETHTGDRPYLCPICPYGARISDHLLAHIGSMHGDSHAYFCELCRKPFKRYSQLQVHIKRMHKDVKNFDRDKDGKIDIKLESGADGVISTGNDVFSVKKIGDCHFEPEVKRKRGRPPKNKTPVPVVPLPQNVQETSKPGSVQIKQERITSAESSMKLATYQDGFRLPLASKGFQFNFDKTGKKPQSWFMQPENMHGKAAVKQRAYMAKKERYFDRLNNGRIQRVRKKSDVVYNGLNMLTRATAQKVCGVAAPESDKSVQEKHLEPHRLLISGRTKLKSMRKIRRRIRTLKASLKGSSLLEDPASTQTESFKACCETEGGHSDNKEEINITKSDDEDDVPLSRLKVVNTSGKSGQGNQPSQSSGTKTVNISAPKDVFPSERHNSVSGSHSNKSADIGCKTESQIRMVLKRKKTGTFKVTLNTSAHVPNTLKTPVRKIPNVVSDIYKGSVRILGKSLQSKSNCSPCKSAKTKKSAKSNDSCKQPRSLVKRKNTRNNTVSHASQKHTSMKGNTNVNRSKKQASKTSKGFKRKQKENKIQRMDVVKSKSPQRKNGKIKKTQNKLNKSNAKDRPKSKQPKQNNARPKPKGRKKNLICSIGVSKVAKKSDNITKTSRGNKRFLQTRTEEEFPIKIEPLDDEYDPSLKSSVSHTTDANLLSAEMLVKAEDCSQVVDHLPNCPGYYSCACAAAVKEECSGGSEQTCNYLYDVKADINVDESYNAHAIAWGLNVESRGEVNKCAQETIAENDSLARSSARDSMSVVEKMGIVDTFAAGASGGSDQMVIPSQKKVATETVITGKQVDSKPLLRKSPSSKRSQTVLDKGSDLGLVDVKDQLAGETHDFQSVYCWGGSHQQNVAQNFVLPNCRGDLLESPPLDLSFSKKLEPCGEEADGERLMNVETQDKDGSDVGLPVCPVSYTYTF